MRHIFYIMVLHNTLNTFFFKYSLSQSNTHTNSLNSFWNDEMTSFSGLEIEPLPSLFQFSPGYK